MPTLISTLGGHLIAGKKKLFGNARGILKGMGKILDPGNTHAHDWIREKSIIGGNNKSQTQANMRPPAIQAPCTAAMVGLGMSRQRRHIPR